MAVALVTLLATPVLWVAPVVTGVVLDGRTGEPVRGASLQVEGTETETTSDLDGLVSIGLLPGTYTVVVTKEGYVSRKVTDMAVTEAGGTCS